MKRFIFIGLILPVALLFIISGCNKTDKEESGKMTTINPSPATSDQQVNTSMENFKNKGFKLLSENYWLDSDKPKYMAIFSKSGDGSHVSSAEIGGMFAEYTLSTKKWAIKAESLSFTTSGSWGEAPSPRFIKLGKDRYGFLMEAGSTNQGYTNTSTSIYGVIGSNFVEMLSIPTGASNSVADENEADQYEVNVTLNQQLDNKKDYYDIIAKLSIAGKYKIETEDEFGKVFGKSQSISYIFKDGTYIKTVK